MSQERTSDVSDRATQEEERATQEAIAQASRVKSPPKDWDKETCYDCGEGLPAERIKASRFKCVGCKTLEEKRMKGY